MTRPARAPHGKTLRLASFTDVAIERLTAWICGGKPACLPAGRALVEHVFDGLEHQRRYILYNVVSGVARHEQQPCR
jgi:hypothetical protein